MLYCTNERNKGGALAETRACSLLAKTAARVEETADDLRRRARCTRA